jgi:CRP-like cAMP-binding protein
VLDVDAKAELISRAPLFAGCSEEDLRTIAQIATEADFGSEEVLFEQGDAGGKFFVLLDGRVDVSRDGKPIDTLGSGDFFGEIALITKAPRNATVTAIEPLRTLVIEAEDFRDLLQQSHKLFYKVFVVLARRVPAEPI